MAKKEFTYRGRSVAELQAMPLDELIELLPSRLRRNYRRGWTDQQKLLLKVLEKKDSVKTHCREMMVLPSMFNKTISIYNGKEFVPVLITEEMIGHVLGEFATTRKKVSHNSPGIGATRSSAAVSVR
jgi:small subunit ribosomal protein S19